MKKFKWMAAALVLVMTIALFAGCSGGDTKKESSKKEIKVVSLLPGDTEILYALGLDKEIVGVSTYCNYPEKAEKHKTKLGTGAELNVEDVIAQSPDIVFTKDMLSAEDKIKQLKDAGIKVIKTDASTVEETYEIILMIGKETDKEEEAQKIVKKMKAEFKTIKEEAQKVKREATEKVYVEVSPLEQTLYVSGKNTFHNEFIELIGAKNVFSEVDGWQTVSEETVIKKNPTVILTTTNSNYGIEDPVGSIMKRAGWAGITAVKDKRVYEIDGDMSTRGGPRLVEAAKSMYELIYN